ncbi:energy transducer TonB [Pseudoalteromonas sp. SSDWG2]|uniref:energy transducer TonB n=1 Tax=Pseudoalteromonas sp. SSDWG2 TaxID=3139391 RepID=UPI003BAB7370
MEYTIEHEQSWFKPSVKFALSAISAATITLATFTFMVSLLNQPQRFDNNAGEDIIVEIMEPPKDSEVITKERPLPPPPQPRPQQRPVTTSVPDTDSPVITLDRPDVSTNIKDSFDFNQASRSAVTPIVRVPPQYPTAAAREGIEGYVVLSYDISATGQVINAKVIGAEPKRTFDKEALRALKKWKFSPMVIDGVAKGQTGLQVRLDFNLQQ